MGFLYAHSVNLLSLFDFMALLTKRFKSQMICNNYKYLWTYVLHMYLRQCRRLSAHLWTLIADKTSPLYKSSN